jgi:recombination protein RecA
LDIRRKAAIKKGEENVGNNVQVKVVKNKVAPPFKTAEFDLMFGTGIDFEGEIIDSGIKYGVVDRAGSWISYSEEKLGQGKEGARTFLKEHPEITEKIKKEILAKVLAAKEASE